MNIYQIIKMPLVTEKGQIAQQMGNQYFFAVNPKATKRDIRRAVEAIFKVEVLRVNTMRKRGKYRRVGRNVGRTSAWKKAIVTLREGDRIEYVEGV